MCLLVMCSSLSPNYAVSSRMHFSVLDSTQSYSLKSRGVPLKRSTLHLPFSGYRFYSHFLCPAFPQCDVSLELVPWWIAGFLLHLPLQHSKHALGSLLFWSLQPRNVLISRTSLLAFASSVLMPVNFLLPACIFLHLPPGTSKFHGNSLLLCRFFLTSRAHFEFQSISSAF